MEGARTATKLVGNWPKLPPELKRRSHKIWEAGFRVFRDVRIRENRIRIRKIMNSAGRAGAMPISQIKRPFGMSSCVGIEDETPADGPGAAAPRVGLCYSAIGLALRAVVAKASGVQRVQRAALLTGLVSRGRVIGGARFQHNSCKIAWAFHSACRSQSGTPKQKEKTCDEKRSHLRSIFRGAGLRY
jgi:hypothetical protein